MLSSHSLSVCLEHTFNLLKLIGIIPGIKYFSLLHKYKNSYKTNIRIIRLAKKLTRCYIIYFVSQLQWPSIIVRNVLGPRETSLMR